MDKREVTDFEQTYQQILTELREALGGIDPIQVEELISALMEAEKIFTTGVGRVLLVSKVFAMRLMHLGFRAHVVGEVTTPSIGPSDLLIASSGSGETLTTYNVARMARDHGARVAAKLSTPPHPLAGWPRWWSGYLVLPRSREKERSDQLSP